MVEKEKTFQELYQDFLSKQHAQQQDMFTASLLSWIPFATIRDQAIRVSILYNLYTQYAQQSLDQNPFLTFFLELVDSEEPFSALEQHFVYCILEESMSLLDHVTPQEIYSNPNIMPAVKKTPNLIHTLKLKVKRLVEDPNVVVINQDIPVLLANACSRILTLQENEILRTEKLSNYPVTEYITPTMIQGLIDMNQFIAVDVVPLLLQSPISNLYLQALLNTKVTIQSIEVIHHILINMTLSSEFLHCYISNCIRSCDQMEEGPIKERQVKQVTRFIQSLLEKQVILMKDYFIEIQSFCISYIKSKGVAQLFRLASQEAQINS